MEWIKCNEKLPDNDNKILVFIETDASQNGYCLVAFYDGERWQEDVVTESYDCVISKITHFGVVTRWMPLPD